MEQIIAKIKKHKEFFNEEDRNHLEAVIKNTENIQSICQNYNENISTITFNISAYYDLKSKIKNNSQEAQLILFTSLFATHKFYKDDETIKQIADELNKSFNSLDGQPNNKLNPITMGLNNTDRIEFRIQPTKEDFNLLAQNLCGDLILRKLETLELSSELTENTVKNTRKVKI